MGVAGGGAPRGPLRPARLRPVAGADPELLRGGRPGRRPGSLAGAARHDHRLLRGRGYYCGAFGKWHLGFRPEFNPTRHGFHEYFGVLTGHADYYSYKYFDGTYTLRQNEEPVKAKGYLELSKDDVLTTEGVPDLYEPWDGKILLQRE